MTKEAMKLALEALEMSHELADTGYTDFKKYGLASDKDITEKLSTAITALREALAEQSAQRQARSVDTWVGLTDDEISILSASMGFDPCVKGVIRDAEAKLKELNT